MKTSFLVLAIGALLSCGSVEACDLCAAFSAGRARGEDRVGFFAGIAEQYTHFGTLKNDGEKLSNPADQYLKSSITQFFLGRNFSDDLSIQLNAPWIHRSFRRTKPAGSDEGSETGIGDLVLLARYRIHDFMEENRSLGVHLLGGIQLPTGSTQRLREELDETDDAAEPSDPSRVSAIHGHDLTLGSGAYSFILGAQAMGRLERWVTEVSAQYSLRLRGRFGYRFANDFLGSISPGCYLRLEHDFTLLGALSLQVEAKGKDRLGDQVAEDTGITSLFLGPQLSASFGERIFALVGLDLPLLTHNTATQVVPSTRVRAAFTFQL